MHSHIQIKSGINQNWLKDLLKLCEELDESLQHRAIQALIKTINALRLENDFKIEDALSEETLEEIYKAISLYDRSALKTRSQACDQLFDKIRVDLYLSPFLNMPLELLEYLLSFLDHKDWIATVLVNRQFYNATFRLFKPRKINFEGEAEYSEMKLSPNYDIERSDPSLMRLSHKADMVVHLIHKGLGLFYAHNKKKISIGCPYPIVDFQFTKDDTQIFILFRGGRIGIYDIKTNKRTYGACPANLGDYDRIIPLSLVLIY